MTDQAISPLRRRMIEDMAIRKLAPKTQHDYVQRVKDFAALNPSGARRYVHRSFRKARKTGCTLHSPRRDMTPSR